MESYQDILEHELESVVRMIAERIESMLVNFLG